MFPGQNSQAEGMGQHAYEVHDGARQIFETGSEVIGEDLAEICFGSQTDKLSTSLVQPAIVAAELANFQLLKQKGLTVSLLMGHSLGEIAALGASEAVSVEDTFRITKVRAEVTERSSQKSPGGMAAILGLNSEQAARILANVNASLRRAGETSAAYLANHNWQLEQVLSGHEDAIERFRRTLSMLKSLGLVGRAGVKKLKVPGAFHTVHNLEGVEELKAVIDSVDKKIPKIMLLNNRGEFMINPDYFAGYHSEQLVRGVEWDLMMHVAAAEGITDFTEVILGDDTKAAVLSGFVKKEFPDHKIINMPFGELIRISWSPENSEYMRGRMKGLTSLQEA